MLLLKKDKMPLFSIAEYLENSSISEMKAQDFSKGEALETLKTDLELRRAKAAEIWNLADDEGDFETVAMFEDYVAFLSKDIWFIGVMLK